MRHVLLAGALVLVAARGLLAGAGAVRAPQDPQSGSLAAARAGCVRCHSLPEADVGRFAPIAGPALADAARWHAADGGEGFLRVHHGGDAARDLAAYMASLGAGAPPLANAAVSTAVIERGENLWRELACQTCHAGPAIETLARRTDLAHVAGFLQTPAAHRPAAVHDFGLDRAEATALAAFLLRAQLDQTQQAVVPGFAYECFELQIESAGQPQLDGLVPAAHGLATELDVKVATRENHFALRFTATLQVPAAGEWKFTCGSDDSSFLWIDEQLVVKNENIGPHRRRSGKVRLEAGPHTLRVVHTEAAGGQSLEVLWSGPGVAEQPIPASSASATSRALVPPASMPVPEAAAVARGRQQFHARRCASCHAVDDAALAALPPVPMAKPFRDLGSGNCPQVPGAVSIQTAAQGALRVPLDERLELQIALRRDGCLACHMRDGEGGLPAVVKRGLVEVEDIGDEGRLPPDLTRVGHRLRPAWLEQVLTGGHRVRTYLKVRMPKLSKAAAARYAALFAAVDGKPDDDVEPPFSLEQAQRGRLLVGTGGKNCITCHTFAGKRALGPQGMDLGSQYERLRPAYFRDWLLHAATLRPGTRMPTLWVMNDDNDRAEVDAVRAWLSLGAAAPLPDGFAAADRGMVLEPTDRPVLHGAFLKGLSARCVAVGTALRTHYAYDVEHGQLAWLWRGAFLDAKGTWHGRAGQLLEPLGTDWVVLEPLVLRCLPAPGDFALPSVVIGRRVDADGYPIWRLQIGTTVYEDHLRPRLVQGGSEMVRTLRCVQDVLVVEVPKASDQVRIVATPPNTTTLQPGQTLELVYQW